MKRSLVSCNLHAMRNLSYLGLLIIIAIHMALVGCNHKDEGGTARNLNDSGPAYGDIIVEGSIGDASNLIPILSSDSTSHEISGLVFNGLVKYDKDVNIVGDLAESWEVSRDGLVITFHLRKGVKWHDGYPFTARDVLIYVSGYD